MVAVTRVEVYDSQIAHLFDHGQPSVRFVRDQLRDIARLAQATAPRGGVTSGNRRAGGIPLYRQHRNSGVLRRGPYGAGGSVSNNARHAAWVHNGVAGRITPKTARTLRVPAPNRVSGYAFPSSVRGQRANPWLARAGDRVARRYAAMPRYRS